MGTFDRNSGGKNLMRDLSKNKSKIKGDIEHRKFFKILFLKREQKNRSAAEGGIYVQDRFLILCINLLVYINHKKLIFFCMLVE